ncbi:MAG: hypothetical protein BHW07_00765 [Clostridium sp. CAG_433_25_7]|nr:MAG: hypothetical protein BHW07_00765 [Clostridium sp. CAG_433_25_7]
MLTQFNKSKGFKKIDLNSIYYFEEFSEWLETQEKISKIYRSYLHNFGLDINDNNIPSKTKLMFMRHLLADISLREDFSLTPKDDSNFEDEVINDVLIKKSIDYIVNHSELQEREIDILIKRFGIGDESVKTLEQIGNIYRLSGARIGKIEENALKKLRNPKIKRNIYID